MRICPIMPKVTYMGKGDKNKNTEMSDAEKLEARLKKLETQFPADLVEKFKQIDNYEDLILVLRSRDWGEYPLPDPVEFLAKLKSPEAQEERKERMDAGHVQLKKIEARIAAENAADGEEE